MESATPLSPRHLDSLKFLDSLRTEEPTIGRMLRYQIMNRHFVLFSVLAFALAAICFWSEWPLAALFVLGYYVGFVRYVVWSLRQFLETWPVTTAITDWNKVDEAIATGRIWRVEGDPDDQERMAW